MYYGVTIREKGMVVFEATIIEQDEIVFFPIKYNVFWEDYIKNLVGKEIKIAENFDITRKIDDVLSALMYIKDIGIDIEYKIFHESDIENGL